MKRNILIISLIALVFTLPLMTGCVRRVDLSEKNGPLTTQTYNFSGFTGIDVGSAMKLELMYGPSYNVTVTAGENLLNKIHVYQSGDTLKVDITGWTLNWWWGQNTPVVSVTMPSLNSLRLSGATNGTVTGFNSTDKLRTDISGASKLDMDIKTGYFYSNISGASNLNGRLTASGTDMILSGASGIDLTGSGGNIKLQASGASSIALAYFVMQDADVNLSGASSARMDIKGRLDIILTGASTLKYAGNPTLGRTEISGASTLKRAE
jgi:hypothetical protein